MPAVCTAGTASRPRASSALGTTVVGVSTGPGSGEQGTEGKSPLEAMLDLVVYAPLGLLVSVTEELPALVEKGRQRATLAKMMGEMAAPELQKEASKLLHGVFDRVMPPGPPSAPSQSDEAVAPVPDAASTNGAARPAARPPAPATNGSGGASRLVSADPAASAALAIPGYDSLSAMQVVQRLPGLSSDELSAVRAYEAGHRGRKTILNRADQLLFGSPG